MSDRLTRRARDGEKDLRPVGPERLRQIREAIRNGTYPTNENAAEGLTNIFLGFGPRAPSSDADD